MKYLLYSLIIVTFMGACTEHTSILKIGLVADPQYADKPAFKTRHYRESLNKLQEAVDTFNSGNVDFVQNLGDIIDEGWGNFDSILSIYKNLNPAIKNYHLLGNHDFDIDSSLMKKLTGTLSMPDYYYSYQKEGWCFIVLDATDYAYFSNPLHKRKKSEIDNYYNQTEEKPNHHVWNGAIGEKQQNWLKNEIESAEKSGQKIIIFSHMPIRPLEEKHNLWNDTIIVNLIEKSPNVVAYICGHNHAGGYVNENGIHYITLSGMVDGQANSFGILSLFKDSILFEGFGNQRSLHLKIKPEYKRE
ncbi:MAG: metallophosphoesterase [Mangrovibacterium sp.]